ncbi:hypothetical protein C8Q77DRAFT_1156391 [Trametes polyzona]|nr:hypothetical protein C8Q77DRAFT_1156391 [Trametes polyzona]
MSSISSTEKAPGSPIVDVAEVSRVEHNPEVHDSTARDNAFLAALGYKQEFKRAFTPIEVFALGFSIIGLFPRRIVILGSASEWLPRRCVAIIVGLPAATPKENINSASIAFGGFTNYAFYEWPNGFAFVLSFLAPLWTFGGFDASIHISEEATNARTAVPWAIISAAGVAAVLAINIVIAFCMGTDLESILGNPIGQPMATILFNGFGRKGTLAIWFLMGSSTLTTASRQIVNAHTQTPVNAVWACAFIAALFGLLAFAGPTANSAIFSLGLAGQYTAFSIPIASRFLDGKKWTPGPFTLGCFSLHVSVIAVAWMTFPVIILAFPAALAPTVEGMNYMVAVFLGAITLCLVYYHFPVYGGKHWFNGPQVTLEEAVRAGMKNDPKRVQDRDGKDAAFGLGEKEGA